MVLTLKHVDVLRPSRGQEAQPLHRPPAEGALRLGEQRGQRLPVVVENHQHRRLHAAQQQLEGGETSQVCVCVCVFLLPVFRSPLSPRFLVDFTSWAGILLETSRRRGGWGRWTRGAGLGGAGLQVNEDKAGLAWLCLLL